MSTAPRVDERRKQLRQCSPAQTANSRRQLAKTLPRGAAHTTGWTLAFKTLCRRDTAGRTYCKHPNAKAAWTQLMRAPSASPADRSPRCTSCAARLEHQKRFKARCEQQRGATVAQATACIPRQAHHKQDQCCGGERGHDGRRQGGLHRRLPTAILVVQPRRSQRATQPVGR